MSETTLLVDRIKLEAVIEALKKRIMELEAMVEELRGTS